MKVKIEEDKMKPIKEAMEFLQISDTHSERERFVNLCAEVGAAQLMMSLIYSHQIRTDFPAKFEGYASTPTPTHRPDVCPSCTMPIVQGPNGKWCCNCSCWPDGEENNDNPQ